MDSPINFAHALHHAYADCPERVAIHLVQAKQPDQPITYRSLIEKSSAYAQRYAAAGVQPGDVVVIILQHSELLIYAFWGAVLHGAVPSILPWLTEKLSPEKYRADLAALIGITQPAAIVTYTEFVAEAEQACRLSSVVNRPKVLTFAAEEARATPTPTLPGLRRSGDDLAVLQHSSGSTGLQKGVALSHRAVFNQLQAYAPAIQLSQSDVICSWLPLYHDMGFIASFIMPVLLRVPVVLMSPFDWVRAPAKLLQLIFAYKGTLTWLPNFAFHFLAQKVRPRDLEGIDLSSLRACINCSEPTMAASHALFAEKFVGYGLNPNALCTSYAMAENVFAVTQSGFDGTTAMDAQRGLLSAGKPLTNVRVRILGERQAELAENEIGEIAIHSDCMLSGYYHRNDATAQALVHGWLLTGDLGFLRNGELYVTGRKKDLIIVGGKNVYPQDLERLASEVPGVHAGRVVAFGVFNTSTGTEDVVVIAEATSTPQTEDAFYALADAVRGHITKNSDVAVRVVKIVAANWLYKTSSGKIARMANKEKYLAEHET
jgi:acyl-CoA synthetase (AMP-forming)/AMP-acid ligase II